MDFTDVVKVVNRRSIQVDVMFDGKVIEFPPNGERHLPRAVAYNIVPQSVLKMDSETGVPTVYGLGIAGHATWTTDPIEGSLSSKNDPEVLDRSNEPKLTETEPKVLGKDGVESLGVGKAEKDYPLEKQESDPDPKKPLKKDEVKYASTGVVQPRGSQRGGSGESSVISKKSG